MWVAGTVALQSPAMTGTTIELDTTDGAMPVYDAAPDGEARAPSS